VWYWQILPVNIKGLAGSIATLANWLCAWIVTMTANLLLSWSGGGIWILIYTNSPLPCCLWVHTKWDEKQRKCPGIAP